MLGEIIRAARRRLLFNEVVKQFALSALVAIGGLALLLVVGTRYLEWWVVALIAVAGAAWATVKLRKHVPTEYAAAVWLDTNSGLHDSLSTAHYFISHPERASAIGPEASRILATQLGEAEKLAGNLSVDDAVPFRFPKSLYALAALLLVASGLVGVRYFYGNGLNLSAPITEVVFQDQAAIRPAKTAATKPPNKSDGYEEARSLLEKLGFVPNLVEKPDEKLDEALADALKSPVSSPGAPEAPKLDDNSPNGDPLEPSPDKTPTNKQPGQSNNASNPSEPSGDPGSKGQGDKSLLSKLKDAMDDMLGTGGPQSDKKNGSSTKQAPQSNQPGQMQQGQDSDYGGEEENKGAADGQAQQGQSQKGQTQGKSGGDQSEKQDGPSAAGSGDGEKAIKAAQQLKAMGKISELIGKRAEQVTGESMIEVQSGNQKVRTDYKNQASVHGEGTGEVSRDEIPLSVQSYVQQYFQQVRKPDGGSVPAKAPKQKSTTGK